MECELNPRIPYTELSHIIKKQKEVWPMGGAGCCQALPAQAPASRLLKAGETSGDVPVFGNWPLKLPGSRIMGQRGDILALFMVARVGSSLGQWLQPVLSVCGPHIPVWLPAVSCSSCSLSCLQPLLPTADHQEAD